MSSVSKWHLDLGEYKHKYSPFPLFLIKKRASEERIDKEWKRNKGYFCHISLYHIPHEISSGCFEGKHAVPVEERTGGIAWNGKVVSI